MKTKHTVLLTGGARGLGKAMANVFSAAGFEVYTPSRTEMDLSRPETIPAYVSQFELGTFDVLINNAGINITGSYESVTMATLDEMIRVNLTAPFLLAQTIVPHLRHNQWGRIVNISSIFSMVTRAGRSSYSCAKAGLNGLTRSLAVELAPNGILVNSVAPGYVETDLTRQNNTQEDLKRIASTIPLGRLAQPEEIANYVLFLCSESNTYITGQTLLIDGGFTCL